MKLIKSIIISGLVLACFVSSSALAQTNIDDNSNLEVQGLAITPFLFDLEGELGQNLERSISITNTTGKAMPISVSINDFVPTETGQPRFLDSDRTASDQYSLAKWITITGQPSFTIEPGQTTQLSFTITPPENAEPGTHYGGILFSYKLPTQKGSNTEVIHKVAAVILLNLGRGTQQGKITGLYPVQTDNHTIDLSLTFNNFGNTHVVPKGDIVVTNSLGQTVGSTAFNRDGLVVLPETQRTFAATWNSGHFLFGRYKFTAIGFYGNPKLEARAIATLWILPIDTITIIVLILIVLIGLAIFGIKRYNRYIIKKHGQR